ncbi:MAG: DNA-binding response regulator [Bacteroidetes bacterium]|nr:MAG: DNA-binding response regulator [Bacteroidota bacterium]
MTKLTAIIVDDEQDSIDNLEWLINNELPEITIAGKAVNAQNGLEMIIDKEPEIVFLDIQMPDKDGFWLVDKLSKLQTEPCIIFVTAFDEYAIEAIKHAAFDFLTKPVDPDILKETIGRYLANRHKYSLADKLESLNSFFNRGKIKLNNYNGFIIIKTDDIIYCEANSNYCKIMLTDGRKELLTMQLGQVEKKLDKENFVRINRSALVNLDYVDSFNRKTKTVMLSDVLQKYEFKVSSKGVKRLMNF